MHTPITSQTLRRDDDLVRYFGVLMGTAIRRQLWLFFLDDEHRPIGPAMPTDDYPHDPDEEVGTEDLGVLTAAELYGARFAGIMREFELARVVVVWERPGGRVVDPRTRAWAQRFGDALREHGASVRAQLLLHDRGLSAIPPDDLM